MGIKDLVKRVKDKRSSEKLAEKMATTTRVSSEIEIRNKLIEDHLNYAASIASKVLQGLSSSVDYDDVMCNARLGLLEAARKFDPSLNVDFKTFSYYRIKGAIYDGLRKNGWIPRSLYARIKFEQATNEYLQYMAEKQSVIAKTATDELSELYDTVNSLASIYVISVDASEEGMEIEDKSNQDIEESAQFQQIKQYMKESIESLPDKERKLIKMYYFQNKTLEEAGEVLGLSKSWVSRLHARSLELLFKRISTKVKGEGMEGVDTAAFASMAFEQMRARG